MAFASEYMKYVSFKALGSASEESKKEKIGIWNRLIDSSERSPRLKGDRFILCTSSLTHIFFCFLAIVLPVCPFLILDTMERCYTLNDFILFLFAWKRKEIKRV